MRSPSLFSSNVNWKALVGEDGAHVGKIFGEVSAILSAYGREFTDESGLLIGGNERDASNHEEIIALIPTMQRLVSESNGAITPGMTPNLFQRDIIREGTTNYEPDMSFLDWVYQRKMVGEVETRASWEADLEFVRVDEYGMVKYGKFLDTERTMRNYEYGAGIPIKTTWFETNTFGIEMESLAPKFRWAYFDELMSTAVYAALVAGITTAITTTTQNVIRDLNTAMYELMRYENSWDKKPWGNARFRIIAPPECSWFLNAAFAMSYGLLSREVLIARPSITYTTKLAAGSTIYVIVDNWEQNELGQRVPFGVYGRANDIDTFSEKISYRGAWGFQMDSNSGRKIVFDPTDADFVIGGPFGTVDLTPTS